MGSSSSELINSAGVSPFPVFFSAPSALTDSNDRIRDKSSPTSALPELSLVKIATNREKACPPERSDRDNFVGVVDDTEREDSREMISQKEGQRRS